MDETETHNDQQTEAAFMNSFNRSVCPRVVRVAEYVHGRGVGLHTASLSNRCSLLRSVESATVLYTAV